MALEVGSTSSMSPSDKGKPVMEYVRHLESRVRQYQSADRRFWAWWFFWGFCSGVLATGLAFTVSALWLK
jgi:hypothetical protein